MSFSDEVKPSAPREGRHGGAMKKELGMLMLLLAAETVADCCVTTEGALSTEMIAVRGCDSAATSTAKLVGNKILPASSAAAASASEPFDDASTPGDSDSSTPVPEMDDEGLMAWSHGTPRSVVRTAFAANGTVVGHVLSFLSWRDNIRLRGVSRLWFEKTLSRAAVCRLPSTGCPAVFLPCRTDFDETEAAEEARWASCEEFDGEAAAAAAASWACGVCGWFNECRALCGNRNCHAMAPTIESRGTRRIFLGQLRREGTVPLIRWLFEEVLVQPHALMMVENHRHKITHRGKGCAWVYLRDEAACTALLSYHRRLFVDLVNSVEGAWIVHPKDTESLAREVAARGYSHERPRHLPRNALVTEVPLAQPPTRVVSSSERKPSTPTTTEPPPVSSECAAVTGLTAGPVVHENPAQEAHERLPSVAAVVETDAHDSEPSPANTGFSLAKVAAPLRPYHSRSSWSSRNPAARSFRGCSSGESSTAPLMSAPPSYFDTVASLSHSTWGTESLQPEAWGIVSVRRNNPYAPLVTSIAARDVSAASI